MNTFQVPCKACGSPVDTGVVDVQRAGRRETTLTARRPWVPALEVDRECEGCGYRGKYSLQRSVLLTAP